MTAYIPARDEQGKQLPPTSDIPTGEPLVHPENHVIPTVPGQDALPDDFRPFDHLQAVYIPQYNALIRKFFSDHPDDWKPNIATARSSLRVACTMLNEDNHAMMHLRSSLFFDLLGYSKKNLVTFYGSYDTIAPPVEGHPKVTLYFSQDAAAVPVGNRAVDMECSFRLMKETQLTFTKEESILLAQKLKTQFVLASKGIKFVKGKTIYKYYDEVHGYRLLIRGNSEEDSIDLIKRLLEMQDVVFDENKLIESIPKRSNMAVPLTQEIMGKEVKKPRYRPTADLYFRYATVAIPGLENPIFLVDATGRHHALA